MTPSCKGSPCKEWQGPRTKRGYGIVWIKGTTTTAHRKAFADSRNIPLEQLEGLVVCHRCDNPPCVNPLHLFLGTQKDNMADMAAKGRGRYPGAKRPNPLKGESCHFAELTEETVLAIRAAKGSGASIARRFNVSDATVSRIRRHLIWKHLK